MSSLYLIRHGQAGSRANYDVLSDLGRRQAFLLGEYFREAGIRFAAAYTGSMRRQQETADLVLGGMGTKLTASVDARWNEFSLEGLWTTLGPKLIEADEEFARAHAEVHLRTSNLDRVMTTCDVQLIRSWVGERLPCPDVESWADFRERVESPRPELARHGSGEAVAVFTSATPTAIWCGSALGVDDRQIFRIAGVIYNSSFSTLRLRDGEARLFSLNNTPHLTEPSLRTFR